MAETTLQGCGVYRILNLVNGKFYIGSSIEVSGRWRDHLYALRSQRHHSYRLQADYDIHGESSFVAELVEAVADPATLLKVEQWWIDHTRCCEESLGYNIAPTAGNTLGKPCLPATREKIGSANRGRRQSPVTIARRMETLAAPEHKERMARWFRTEETRSKVSRTKGGSGYVLTVKDIERAVGLYETGNYAIRAIALMFRVGYSQMRNALHGNGPKFGSTRQTDISIRSGNSPKEVAAKISRTLSLLSDRVVQKIREKYETGLYTQLALADEFGVDPVIVNRIVKTSQKPHISGVKRSRGTRVSPEVVREIRSLYSSGDYTQHDLRRKLGVPRTVIGRIINYQGPYRTAVAPTILPPIRRRV
jgi:group I intron endonuclease